MASKVGERRLQKEYLNMQKSPPPFIWASPEEKNILDWHFIIRGPPDTPYDGGEYHGLIWFPPEYPFKPPDVKLFTPSGRFQVGQKICMSMTSYHPSTWNAAWSVATILTGLLSFMLSDEITAGAVKTSDDDKRAFAKESHAFNIKNKKFRDIFPTYATPQMTDLPDMGKGPSGSQVNGSNKTSTNTSTTTTTTTTPAPSTRAPTPHPIPPGISGISGVPNDSTSTPLHLRPRHTPSSDDASLQPPIPQILPAAQAAQAPVVGTRWFSWRVAIAVVVLAVLGRLSSRIGGA